MRWVMFGLIGTAMAMPTAAQQVPPAADVPTVQALFEQAEAAVNAGEYRHAVDLYTTLEGRTKNPRNLAIIGLRKGLSLIELGDRSRAEALLVKALPALPESDPTLADDRAVGLRGLARVALSDFDYGKAQRLYAQSAAATADPSGRVAALTGEALAAVFVDPAAALEKADEAERLLATFPNVAARTTAYVAEARGRALLNLGRFAEAEHQFSVGVRAQGGLSLKVDYDDLVARSDASIAAMLAGHRDQARSYLLYTGAGRTESQHFMTGADMPLPICGEDDVRPDDVAVVEFSIQDDGAVGYARPIYGSRPGSVAVTFARAVSRWSWRPEDVAGIPPLMRFATRLELRCSTGEGGPSLRLGLVKAYSDWIETRYRSTSTVRASSGEVQRKVDMRAAITRLRAADGDSSSALGPAIADLLGSPLVSKEERAEYRPLLDAIVRRDGPPPLARLYLDLLMLDLPETRADYLRYPAVSETPYLDAPDALTTIRLMRYDRLPPREKPRSRIILDRIIADTRLEAENPLRIAALMRRASLLAAEKDLDGARRDFATTGLSTQQCSIVDPKPGITSQPNGSGDYPSDMVRVGIEGWTQVQLDIGVDGTTRNQRAIISYPPMVFGDASQKIVSRVRFEQSYRPAGSQGCGGNIYTLIFRTPH